MSDYSEILDKQRWSFSSLSNFNTCPYGFKLTYIDKMDREQNFYAEFGLLVHEVLMLFFQGKIEPFELSQVYKEKFNEFVKSPLPAYQSNLKGNYYNFGLNFFDNFDFDRDNYIPMFIEDTINVDYKGLKLVVKPDLVLYDKNKEIATLYDYKTSNIIS